MTLFNRIVAILLWLALLAIICITAVAPLTVIDQVQSMLAEARVQVATWREQDAASFVIGQATAGVAGLLIFGSLIWLEVLATRRRGVRIRTADGGSAELDTSSISRRLEWHLDQLAEVVAVVPTIKSRGGSVNVKLEIEAAPDVDIPMKTDEVVDVTRDIVEEEMGLKLGKLDVHMRCVPFEPEWTA